MENRFPMKNSFFLDTSYSIALIIERDQFHSRAVELSFEIEEKKAGIVTTQGILLEIGNALAKIKYRKKAVRLLQELESDKRTSIVDLTPDLYDRAFELFRDRTDKDWSLVDCISFVVMREKGINDALTGDEHFVQAGFRALLRED